MSDQQSTDERAVDQEAIDREREELFDEIRARRGFLLPVHELMGALDPSILRQYNALASNLLFSPEPRALDMKTRFLVLLGVTTAVKGDREGIEWSMRNARKHGATEREVLEAICLSALPGGIPTVEAAALAWQEVREGKGIVEDDTA